MQQHGSASGNRPAIDLRNAQITTQVTTDRINAQSYPHHPGTLHAESHIIHIIILFDGTPGVGCHQPERVATTILIAGYHPAVVDMTLHVVGASSHQQTHTGSLALDRNLQTVRIIVEEGGESDILSALGREEGYVGQHHLALTNLGTEHRVVDGGRQRGMAPFANSLHGNLQGGHGRSRTEILILEDIRDRSIEHAVHLHWHPFLHLLGQQRRFVARSMTDRGWTV